MTDKITEMKALVAEAFAEAKVMSDSACNLRGHLWRKKREHLWDVWRKEMIKKSHTGEVISFMYVRTCEHCGAEQFREQLVK